MSHLRFKVIEEAYNRKAVHIHVPDERPETYYAKAVFNRQRCLNTYPETRMMRLSLP